MISRWQPLNISFTYKNFPKFCSIFFYFNFYVLVLN